MLLAGSGNVRTVTGQTVSVCGNWVTAAGLTPSTFRAECRESMALEAELPCRLVEHTGGIAGVHRMAGLALALLHGRVDTRSIETVLQFGMAIVAAFAIEVWQRERLRHIGRPMTVAAGLSSDWLVNNRLEQLRVVSRVDAVAIIATGHHRVVAMRGSEGLF